MEAPGSPYASSPESAPKRAPRSSPPPPQERPESEPEAEHEDEKEKPTHLRFLVSNTAAGCIIGKGGSTINDFQSQSGARIQLSRSHEFFPGTNDRIIMVSGQFDEVIKAMELVLEKLLAEGEESNEAEARPKFRLVVPNSSCGGIIGKGGATIKSFIEDSHAGIKISPQDNNFVGLHDRLVTITGPLNTQLRAIYLILNKLSEDVHYPPNLSSPFPYAGLGFPSYPAAVPVGYMIPQVPYNNAVNYGPNGYGGGGGGGRYQNNKPGTPVRSPANNDAQESHTIGVADEHIGAVVGRAGKNITEIIQASGARIKISDRGDFIAGTSDRKVTITGSSEAIQVAESMIMQRVAASSERERSDHGQASRRLYRPLRRCSGVSGAHVVGPESPHPDLYPARRPLLLLRRQGRLRLRQPQLRGLVVLRFRHGPPRARRQPAHLRRQGGRQAPGLRGRGRLRLPHRRLRDEAAGPRARGPPRPRAAARPPRPRRRLLLLHRHLSRRGDRYRRLHRHPGRSARRLHRRRGRRGSGPHRDGARPRGAARCSRPHPALQAPPRRARRDRLRRAQLQPDCRLPPHPPRGLLEEGARRDPRRDGLLRGRHGRRPRRRALRRPPRQPPPRQRAAPHLMHDARPSSSSSISWLRPSSPLLLSRCSSSFFCIVMF